MRLKRYLVNDMRQALPLIRAEMGPEAMIVQTQMRPPKGLRRLWRKPQIEVLAAVEDERPLVREALPAKPATEDGGRLLLLEQRLEKLSQAVESMAAQPLPIGQHPLHRSFEGLRQQGLSQALLDRLRPTAGHKDASAMALQLRHLLPPCVPLTLKGDAPDVLFFLGPTGVGKTTTLAKVAAELAGRRGSRVALVTIDTYRVAAVPQLEIYADLLGVPLEVAYSPEELAAAVQGFAGYDAVLVDTPGRGPSDAGGLGELQGFLGVVPGARALLLLEAGSHLENMRHAAAAFGADRCEGLIFTKLDETKVYGPSISLACEVGRPVYYFTTGQNVPHDIEPATDDQLLVLLMGATARKPEAGDFVRVGARELAHSFSGSQAW